MKVKKLSGTKLWVLLSWVISLPAYPLTSFLEHSQRDFIYAFLGQSPMEFEETEVDLPCQKKNKTYRHYGFILRYSDTYPHRYGAMSEQIHPVSFYSMIDAPLHCSLEFKTVENHLKQLN